MNARQLTYLTSIFFLFLIPVKAQQRPPAHQMQTATGRSLVSETEREAFAKLVKAEFVHAWNGYKKYAWGHDALKPLSKSYRDWYAHSLYMTPLDGFDTMILMGLEKEKEEAKKLILSELRFDHDMPVQVFEVTIRVLGGLLSAYQLDGDPKFLQLAEDLGQRMLPAFNSPTGMPYRMVNLKTGETDDHLNNPAEIGTLQLEFGLLSKLTGNPVYYDKAKKACTALFEHRSDIGLVGTVINVNTGEWVETGSHISGMIDSYYEYLLKCGLFFDDADYLAMWNASIGPVNQYLLDTAETGLWYSHVDMHTGKRLKTQFGALDAFMPALLALGGDIETAKAVQESCYKMWTTFRIEPEQIDYTKMEILSGYYVLRPENIESATYLYHHTGDRKYFEMGKTMFESIVKYCRTEEAYAELSDVSTMTKTDGLESFFFAETLKYAYLLGNDTTPKGFTNTIFNTEAHPFQKTW